MDKDNLILIAAAAVAYWIVTKPSAAATSTTSTRPLPTTGDFARMDRMAAADTVGALGEPVSFFAPAGYI